MLRRHASTLHLALAAADALSATALFMVLSIVRFGADWQRAWESAGVDPWIASAAWGASWAGVLWLQGLDRLRARLSIRREVVDIAMGTILLAVAVFSILFLLKLPSVSRLFLLALFATQTLVGVLSRLAIRWLFTWARARGVNLRYAIVIGTGAEAQGFVDRLERHPDLGVRVIGHIRVGDLPVHGSIRHPVLADIEEIEALLHREVVDEVIVVLPPDCWSLVGSVVQICQEEGKIVRVPLHDVALTLPGAREESFDGVKVMSLVHGPDRWLALAVKAAIDLIGAGIGLILLMPVLVVIGAMILVSEGRPVLFRQDRVGMHGRTFRVVKFRTMVRDAEAQLSDLAERNELVGHAFKVSGDPRVTPIGRFLRRTSLDELPQLWNVVRGEMSLVGPRPPLTDEVRSYDVWHRRRLSMKPGITGLWQVAARREAEFDRWVRLDLDYIDRWSLWLDLKILLRTLPAMLQGR